MNILDIVALLGYPLVGYLAYRGGKIDGIVAAFQALHDQGVINLDDAADD